MIQELGKPKDNLQQVIIKRNGDSCSVRHYGHPDLAGMTTMLGMHSVSVFDEMQIANPDFSPQQIEHTIITVVKIALELAQKEIITEDD